jgi:hypothetical protein
VKFIGGGDDRGVVVAPDAVSERKLQALHLLRSDATLDRDQRAG